MERFYQYPLGEHADRTYLLTVSGEPSINDAEEFAVTAHYNDSETRQEVQIARIDTSHGYSHFNELFRDDWRRYARHYEENHGAGR